MASTLPQEKTLIGVADLNSAFVWQHQQLEKLVQGELNRRFPPGPTTGTASSSSRQVPYLFSPDIYQGLLFHMIHTDMHSNRLLRVISGAFCHRLSTGAASKMKTLLRSSCKRITSCAERTKVSIRCYASFSTRTLRSVQTTLLCRETITRPGASLLKNASSALSWKPRRLTSAPC